MKKILIAALITLIFILFSPVTTIFASITISQPNGSESTLPEARDFATLNFSDPWDMTNSADAGLFNQNFKSISMSGGYWKATTSNRYAKFWMQWGGYPGSYPNGREGIINKVNADFYKRFSFRMYSSRSGKGRLWWFWAQNMDKKGWLNIDIRSGWNIYLVDLPSSWNGNLTGVRFDPITIGDTRVMIDWLRLTQIIDNADSKITWDNTGSDGNATIFLDNNSSGYDGTPIAEVYSNFGTNNYTLNTSGLAPGNYYLYIGKNGEYSAYSPGPIKINQSPVLSITDPDEGGGKDWATNYIGNSWNMSQYSDAEKYGNITGRKISGGIFSGVNYAQTQKNDPFMWLRLAHKLINTNNYRYLSFRYRYDGKFDLRRGTMSRFVWRSGARGWNISDDIVTYGGGWRTYYIDLKTIKLNGGRNGWRGNTDIFRFDPHEDRLSKRFYVDHVTLAAEDKLSTAFIIRYQNKDASGGETNTLRLYWDADKIFGNGNEHLIVEKPISNGSGYYKWRPSRSLKRRVWIYAQISDGINTNGYYSTGMLRVHM